MVQGVDLNQIKKVGRNMNWDVAWGRWERRVIIKEIKHQKNKH